MFKLVMIRTAALLIGSAVLFFSVRPAVRSFRDITAQRSAQVCAGGVPTPAADANGCIIVEYGVVTGRSTKEGQDGTLYEVDLQTGSGAAAWQWHPNVDESFYDAVAIGQKIEVKIWRNGLFGLVSGRVSTGFESSGSLPLVLAGSLAWIGLGLVVWFLAGDGSLIGLLGWGYAQRAITWVVGGAIFMFFGVDLFTDYQGFGSVLVDGVLGAWGPILAYLSVAESGPFPENESLLVLARKWPHRRKMRWLRRQVETRPRAD